MITKTEIHAYGSELAKATVEELVIGFTAEETENAIFHDRIDFNELIVGFEFCMEIIAEDDDMEFSKIQYPATIKALQKIQPFIPAAVKEKFDLSILA